MQGFILAAITAAEKNTLLFNINLVKVNGMLFTNRNAVSSVFVNLQECFDCHLSSVWLQNCSFIEKKFKLENYAACQLGFPNSHQY